jgi:hypothetical protein
MPRVVPPVGVATTDATNVRREMAVSCHSDERAVGNDKAAALH